MDVGPVLPVRVKADALDDAGRDVCSTASDNETVLPLFEHTTDTAGYTDLVFALFDLLGLQFSPRLRDLGDQRLYRMDRTVRYGHLDPLIRGRIGRDFILKHWDDLLRIAGSLKMGWVTASLRCGGSSRSRTRARSAGEPRTSS